MGRHEFLGTHVISRVFWTERILFFWEACIVQGGGTVLEMKPDEKLDLLKKRRFLSKGRDY